MCLFNFPNKTSTKAYLKGLVEFECGGCPECLQKKSRLWALRCSMESKVSPGVMVTLTYDSYKIKYGKKTQEENPTDPTIPLSKRYCQLFMKRLRKHFAPLKIKYLITAERGKKTHRAHYHALLFGVQFNDLVKYKRSDRGNWIYKSKTLEKIWTHGICTVDCINLSAKTARYCTKYCAKDSGVDDTFMLFSRGIGETQLLKEFNGLSYWIDGREYSIPKQIWQKVIEEKYNLPGYSRYTPKRHLEDTEKILYNALSKPDASKIWSIQLNRLMFSAIAHERGRKRNEYFQYVRDNDYLYKRYLSYWHKKADVYKITQPSPSDRILSLPDNKYRSYKQKAIVSKHSQVKKLSFVPPRSNSHGFDPFHVKKVYMEKTFAPLSRHYWANDTITDKQKQLLRNLRTYYLLSETKDETFVVPFTLSGAKFYKITP